MAAENEYENEVEEQLARAIQVRSDLQASRKKEIKDLSTEFPSLWELLILDLNSGGQGADPELARSLGINISLLNKFIKSQKKPISISDARTVADRIVTHLRSVRPSARVSRSVPPQEPAVPRTTREENKPFVVNAVAWKIVAVRDDLQAKIGEAVHLLEEVIRHATNTNLPPDARALSDLERAQLIAVLKTTLKMLEAPMVETGLLKKATSMLKRAGAKAIERQVENAFAFAAGYAAGQLTALAKFI